MNRRPLDYESSALPLSYCGVPLCGTATGAGSVISTSRECPGADSNRDAFRHSLLKTACLPISPPGQTHLRPSTATLHSCQLTDSAIPKYRLAIASTELSNTGATGLEPATSRVTVECSNQTELRPQQHTLGTRTETFSLRRKRYARSTVRTIHGIARRGIEPLSAP